MKFTYNNSTEELSFEDWQGSWTAKPIFMIRCICGAPIKAMFEGNTPASIHNMDKMGFGDSGQHSKYSMQRIPNIGWMFEVTKNATCICGAEVETAYDDASAVTKYVKRKLYMSRKIVNQYRVHDLIKRIKNDPKIKRYFSLKSEEIAARPDAAFIVKYDSMYRQQFNVILKELKLTYDYEDYWNSGDEQRAHYDLEKDIIAAHAQDCTCSLCLR